MRRQRYKEKLDSERAELEAAGFIAESHPGISHIDCRLVYYRRGMQQAYLKRTLSFTPADHAGFRLKCVDAECANGGFDLAPVIAAMAKARKRTFAGTLFCRSRSDAAAHASMGYVLTIRYR